MTDIQGLTLFFSGERLVKKKRRPQDFSAADKFEGQRPPEGNSF
jgi:hypothetical protein